MDAKCNRNNFTIEYKNNCFGLIKLFLLINEKLFIIIQELVVEKSDFKVKTANLNVNDAFKKFNKFFKKITIKKNFLLIDSESVVNKCILIFLDKNIIYLTPLVDFSEID